jgi:hypothetical protein
MERVRNLYLIAIVFTLIVAPVCMGNLAANSGFEAYEGTSGGRPSMYGDWRGDFSEIVGSRLGITPFEGSRILQFEGADTVGHDSGDASQLFQIIDISSYKPLISVGSATCSASAYFNRITGDQQTDTKFWIALLAYSGSIDTFPSQYMNANELVSIYSTELYSDGNVNTWEQCQAELTLPTNTDFIVFEMAAVENIYNDLGSDEFDGHFADMVSVEIVPEPATLLMLGWGGFLLSRRKK